MKATRIGLICALCLASALLIVMNIKSVTTPIKFNDTRAEREVAIKQHLIDLRAAQTEYYHVYGKYTDNADSLVIFLQTTPKKSIRKEKSLTDNQLENLKLTEEKAVKIIEIYAGRYNNETIKDLIIIPYSQDEARFIFKTSSYASQQGDVALFEMMAPFDAYLWDLDKQELANLIDAEARKEIKRKDPHDYLHLQVKDVTVGLKVGDIDSPNGGHGNWE